MVKLIPQIVNRWTLTQNVAYDVGVYLYLYAYNRGWNVIGVNGTTTPTRWMTDDLRFTFYCMVVRPVLKVDFHGKFFPANATRT